MPTTLKVCVKCVMDNTAQEITFDKEGICNFCYQAETALIKQLGEKRNWPTMLNWVMENGEKGKYDCVVGLSGGVDSSMALVQAVEHGLRPLCFTVDNGWNTPEADENILQLVEKLKVPLEKVVLHNEFKSLQAAFISAGVINIEIPTDHILMAVAFQMAKKHKVKWIISGGNVETESIMPASWSYTARDLKHIKAIYKRLARKKIKRLPTCSLWQFNWYKWINRIKTLYLLDYTGYNRSKAIEYLKEHFDYKGYGEKHCESIYTHWFQNFYLFEKFGIDKRKAHLSSLINSGQIDQDEALNKLMQSPVYPEIGLEARAMSYPRHEHSYYPTDAKLFGFINKIIKFLKDHGIIRRFQNLS